MSDLVGTFIGFTLTLFIFSYAWGDNPFFRIATNIFVGAAAGYALVITINNIVIPHLINPLLSDSRNEIVFAILYLIPCALIFAKLSPRLSTFGSPALAILVGIGAAAAIGGAVIGTLSPQVAASINIFENPNFINAVIILIGTLTVLVFFHFGVVKKSFRGFQTDKVMQGIRRTGQVFIAITFGAVFSGIYFAALTALIERISYLWTFLYELLGPLFSG